MATRFLKPFAFSSLYCTCLVCPTVSSPFSWLAFPWLAFPLLVSQLPEEKRSTESLPCLPCVQGAM